MSCEKVEYPINWIDRDPSHFYAHSSCRIISLKQKNNESLREGEVKAYSLQNAMDADFD